MHQTRHWATSPGGQEPLFAQRKKAKPLLLLLFEGRNPDCSTWQRMLALLARFPGEALLVRNFQPWARVQTAASHRLQSYQS